jgi:hypothetical protein
VADVFLSYRVLLAFIIVSITCSGQNRSESNKSSPPFFVQIEPFRRSTER